MTEHEVVNRDRWTEARKTLLKKEKEFTRLRDNLSAERRALPWVRIDKAYVFDTPEGKCTLADLFDGKSQLSVASAILERDPEPISVAQPAAPPALQHLVEGALMKDPEARWQSAADIARQLRWIRSPPPYRLWQSPTRETRRQSRPCNDAAARTPCRASVVP